MYYISCSFRMNPRIEMPGLLTGPVPTTTTTTTRRTTPTTTTTTTTNKQVG